MNRFTLTAAAAVGCLALAGPTAQAALTIRVIQSGGPTLTVTDNMAGDTDPTVDSIKVAATGANSITGTFTTLTAGSSFDAEFTTAGGQSQLDNTSRLVRAGSGSRSFTVLASRDGIAMPAGTDKVIDASGSGNFNRGTSTQQFTLGADAANALFAITTPVAATGVFSSPTAFGFGPVSLGFSDPNPYSLTNKAAYTTAAGSTLQSTSSQVVSAVAPAPAGLALALAAVPALGLRRLLRRKAA